MRKSSRNWKSRLLTADVGVQATGELLEALRKKVARKELADVDALLTALRADIAALLAPCAKPLRINPANKPYRHTRRRCQRFRQDHHHRQTGAPLQLTKSGA